MGDVFLEQKLGSLKLRSFKGASLKQSPWKGCSNPSPSNLATMIVEDQPVGRAQEGVAVSSFPQDLHGECLPKDHVMSHRVYILPGTNQFRISKTLEHSE